MTLKSLVSNVTKSLPIAKVTSAVKTLVTPSAKQAEQNRIRAFGTPSKAVATTAVVGATALVLDVGLTKGQVTKTIIKNPKVSIPVVATGIVIASSKELKKDIPKAVSTVGKQTVGVLSGIGTAYDTFKTEGTKEGFSSLGETIKENPLGAAVLGTAALGTSAAGLYYGSKLIGDTLDKTSTPELPKESKISEIPKSITTNAPNQLTKPIEPALVDVSRSISRTKKYSKTKLPSSFSPTIRLTINNQNKNTKFIKFSKYTN